MIGVLSPQYIFGIPLVPAQLKYNCPLLSIVLSCAIGAVDQLNHFHWSSFSFTQITSKFDKATDKRGQRRRKEKDDKEKDEPQAKLSAKSSLEKVSYIDLEKWNRFQFCFPWIRSLDYFDSWQQMINSSASLYPPCQLVYCDEFMDSEI